MKGKPRSSKISSICMKGICGNEKSVLCERRRKALLVYAKRTPSDCEEGSALCRNLMFKIEASRIQELKWCTTIYKITTSKLSISDHVILVRLWTVFDFCLVLYTAMEIFRVSGQSLNFMCSTWNLPAKNLNTHKTGNQNMAELGCGGGVLFSKGIIYPKYLSCG